MTKHVTDQLHVTNQSDHVTNQSMHVTNQSVHLTNHVTNQSVHMNQLDQSNLFNSQVHIELIVDT